MEEFILKLNTVKLTEQIKSDKDAARSERTVRPVEEQLREDDAATSAKREGASASPGFERENHMTGFEEEGGEGHAQHGVTTLEDLVEYFNMFLDDHPPGSQLFGSQSQPFQNYMKTLKDTVDTQVVHALELGYYLINRSLPGSKPVRKQIPMEGEFRNGEDDGDMMNDFGMNGE
jgi:hypothetical protein